MADIPVIVDIEAESFPDPWGGSTFMEILEYSPTTFFVADTGKNIAGFIAGATGGHRGRRSTGISAILP